MLLMESKLCQAKNNRRRREGVGKIHFRYSRLSDARSSTHKRQATTSETQTHVTQANLQGRKGRYIQAKRVDEGRSKGMNPLTQQ